MDFIDFLLRYVDDEEKLKELIQKKAIQNTAQLFNKSEIEIEYIINKKKQKMTPDEIEEKDKIKRCILNERNKLYKRLRYKKNPDKIKEEYSKKYSKYREKIKARTLSNYHDKKLNETISNLQNSGFFNSNMGTDNSNIDSIFTEDIDLEILDDETPKKGGKRKTKKGKTKKGKKTQKYI